MRGFALSRRGALLALAASTSLALGASTVPAPAFAADQTFPIAELMAEPPLPDTWQGAQSAPVTIIEYASMTCTHCAAFHAETWPTLKSKYIDAGKVRFVLREFPLDPLATAGFMLGRCAGPDRRNAVLDLLFDQQKNWAFVDKPVEALENTVKQAGVTHDAFEACLKDQKLYGEVNSERDKAGQQFKVDATPTFYINGVKHAGELSVDDLEKILQPLLKS
ncbi:MAG: DsbA family protein [Janthinobacterium lividum]